MSVDTKAKKVTFKDGTNQHYDQLLISTGGRLDCFEELDFNCAYGQKKPEKLFK